MTGTPEAEDPGSRTLRVAVLSDLHAYQNTASGSAPSNLRVGDPQDQVGINPIAGLHKLIEEEHLEAEILLCPGDLGDRAEAAGIQYAWRAVTDLQSRLGSRLLVATAGNHDLDSRFIESTYDARGYLQSLVPTFPLPSGGDRLNDMFWSRNFAPLEDPSYRVVVVNSCAFHGAAAAEIDYGRISPRTLQYLRDYLSQAGSFPVNILLCHHHPQQQMELGLGEQDFMRSGQSLLDLLGMGDYGRWLVVHGHKHLPKLTYASGPSTSPAVFSAGSFSAVLYRELQTRARNLFHVVTIPHPSTHHLGFAGVVRSWEWGSGQGWERAKAGAGMPFECGFGFRGEIEELAARIAALITGDKESWSAVQERIPEVSYLVPQDMRTLRRELSTRFRLSLVESDSERVIREIGRQL